MFIDSRDLHRPDDRDTLEREARGLRATGLSTFDIAQALGVNVAVAKFFFQPVFDSLSHNSGQVPKRS